MKILSMLSCGTVLAVGAGVLLGLVVGDGVLSGFTVIEG
jgi:hypothetical protein